MARLAGERDGELLFALTHAMEANVPYLILPGSLNASTLADGTSKAAVYNIPGTSTVVPDGDAPKDNVAGVTFFGTYTDVTLPVDDGYYAWFGGTLVYAAPEEALTSGRFRGYFHSASSLTGISVYDPAVGVPMLQRDADDAAVYDVQGRLVRAAGCQTPLPRGIYVCRGRKFLVK